MTNKYADRLVLVEVTHDVAKVWAVREPSNTHPDVILREPLSIGKTLLDSSYYEDLSLS